MPLPVSYRLPMLYPTDGKNPKLPALSRNRTPVLNMLPAFTPPTCHRRISTFGWISTSPALMLMPALRLAMFSFGASPANC